MACASQLVHNTCGLDQDCSWTDTPYTGSSRVRMSRLLPQYPATYHEKKKERVIATSRGYLHGVWVRILCERGIATKCSRSKTSNIYMQSVNIEDRELIRTCEFFFPAFNSAPQTFELFAFESGDRTRGMSAPWPAP